MEFLGTGTAFSANNPSRSSIVDRTRATLASFVVLILSFGISPSPKTHSDSVSVPGGVEVTPKGDPLSVLANATGQTATFQVKNTKTTTATYSLMCTSTGTITCIDWEPTSVNLAPQQTANVSATFNAGSGSSGTITMSASGPASDAGWYDVTVSVPPNPVIALRNFNRDNRDRGLCLTSGAGEAAACSAGICSSLTASPDTQRLAGTGPSLWFTTLPSLPPVSSCPLRLPKDR